MIFFFCVRKTFFFYLLYFCIRYYSGFFPNNIRDIANFKGEGNPLYSLKCFSYLDVRPKRVSLKIGINLTPCLKDTLSGHRVVRNISLFSYGEGKLQNLNQELPVSKFWGVPPPPNKRYIHIRLVTARIPVKSSQTGFV